MNATIGNVILASEVKTLIRDTYESHIQILIDISAFAIAAYAALDKFPHEVQYIWFKRFSLPTLFYIFARYATLFMGGLTVILDFESRLGRTCNVLANTRDYVGLFSLIGVQGLLVARAYSLCQGHKVLRVVLVFDFIFGSSLYLYDIITLPGCSTRSESLRYSLANNPGLNFSIPAKNALILFVTNIVDLLGDVLILAICIWKVWGTWKLGHEAGIYTRHSIVSIILTQSLRCCFAVVWSIVHAVISTILGSSGSPRADSSIRLQNV